MKEGDFVRIDYVARITETDEIFDLTKEEVAREKGLYNPKVKYFPLPVIIGEHHVVRGLEEELKRMKVGEKKKIIVRPEDGFGLRNPELIKLIPLSVFKKQKINPYPGMPILYDKIRGKVLSVSGGRVRVDFNHPLAGKNLEYEVEVKELITDKKEKVKAILELFLNINREDAFVNIKGKVAEIKIKIKKDIPRSIKKVVADKITEWIKDVKKVKFIEEY